MLLEVLQLTDPFSVGMIAAGITAVGGLFVAALAYRGYQRNGSTKMRALAVGIGLLTTGVFLAATTTAVIGAGTGVVLLIRGLVTVIGLCTVLYAILIA
ncbi:hypothetical protein DJ84_10110 [Halorubrum ezzemoulense]|nr:hypothetical protein DJ84_10110 [Halorubrum ezzemoulense]